MQDLQKQRSKNIDKLDIKIILELDRNSRQPYSKLAKNLNTSQQVINYRIKKLIDEKIITGFMTSFSTISLGLPIVAKFYIQLTGITQEIEQEITNYFLNQNNVTWVARTLGKFDIFIAIMVPDFIYLGKFKDELFSKFGVYINNYEIAFIQKAQTLTRTYLGEKQIIKQKTLMMHDIVNMELTNKDKEIMELLAYNSRISVLEIATKLALDVRTVMKKIRLYEKKGIIQGYRININREKLGFKYYKIFIKLKSYNDDIKELKKYCLSQKYVLHFVENIGQYEYEIEIEIPNSNQMQEFIKNIRNNFSSIVENIEAVEIIDELKLWWLPKNF